MNRSRHLVVMVKAPRLGAVKTRLAREIGAVAAWRFYRQVALRTLNELSRDPRWTLWLQITPDCRGLFPPAWLKGRKILRQGKGDLGARMMKPFLELPPGPVVLIGSDIPLVRRKHIWRAFEVLGNKPLVFGPAQDGGFWLVGQRRSPKNLRLFEPPVRWSTEHALTDCLRNLPRQTVGFADRLNDVDDEAAHREWTGYTCRLSELASLALDDLTGDGHGLSLGHAGEQIGIVKRE